MQDLVILIGTSGIGKSTCAKILQGNAVEGPRGELRYWSTFFNDFTYLDETKKDFPGLWRYITLNKLSEGIKLLGPIPRSVLKSQGVDIMLALLKGIDPVTKQKIIQEFWRIYEGKHFEILDQIIITETYRRLGEDVANAPQDGKLKIVEIAAAEGDLLKVDVSSKIILANFFGERKQDILSRLFAVVHLDGTPETKEEIRQSLLFSDPQKLRPETIYGGMFHDNFYQVRKQFPNIAVFEVTNIPSLDSAIDIDIDNWLRNIYYAMKLGYTDGLKHLREGYRNIGLEKRFNRFTECQQRGPIEGSAFFHNPGRKK